MLYKQAALICAMVLILSQAALATTEKSKEKCQKVGSTLVKCYDCRDSSKRYLGNVAVLTDYEEDQGKKFCVVAATAKTKCASAYGVSKGAIGFYTKFKIGMGSSEEFYRTSCVKSVGY